MVSMERTKQDKSSHCFKDNKISPSSIPSGLFDINSTSIFLPAIFHRIQQVLISLTSFCFYIQQLNN